MIQQLFIQQDLIYRISRSLESIILNWFTSDTLQWSSRRYSLVSWIKIYYPYLDGFVYDQTLEGAQNYLKAIELYTDEK